MQTEGQNRWIKGVDPHLAGQASALATSLILELTGARWVGYNDAYDTLPEPPEFPYDAEHADALIGLEVPADEQKALLERLGFDVKRGKLTSPTWRARDVTRDVDAIEEVARFHLDDVPFTLPARRAMFGGLTREQRLRRRVEDTLTGLASRRRTRRRCVRTIPTRTRIACRSRSPRSSPCFAQP